MALHNLQVGDRVTMSSRYGVATVSDVTMSSFLVQVELPHRTARYRFESHVHTALTALPRVIDPDTGKPAEFPYAGAVEPCTHDYLDVYLMNQGRGQDVCAGCGARV